ncbi:MAG: hypothetical protein ACOCU9_02925 [Spirochaetota bacterium]
MRKEKRFVARYTLADLFDGTFAMIRRTWKTSLVTGAAALVVPSLLLGWAVLRMMDNMVTFAQTVDPNAGPEVLWQALGNMSVMPFAGLLAGLAYLVVHLTVVDAVRREAIGDGHTIGGSLGTTLRANLLPVIGQGILKGIIFTAIIAIPTAVLFVLIAITEASGLAILFGTLAYLVAFVVTVWLSVSLSFAPYAIVFGGVGVFGSLRESMQIVKRNWWRVFGYYVLIQLIFSFLIGLISTPFVGVSLLPGLSRIVDAATTQRLTDAQAFEIMSSFQGLGIATVVGSLIQQLVSLLFLPVFYSLFFIDLKVRAGLSIGAPDEE